MLIVVPTSALALWSWGTAMSDLPRPEPIPVLLFVSLALVAIIAVFRLLLALMIGGYERVAAAHRAWWLAMYGGGVLVLSGLLTAMIVWVVLEPSAKARSLAAAIAVIAALGAPMLLPLAHLVIERFRYERSNKTMEPTR